MSGLGDMSVYNQVKVSSRCVDWIFIYSTL